MSRGHLAGFNLDFEEQPNPPASHIHLPPPPEIRGSTGYAEVDGRRASIIPGRAVSPPLFTQTAGQATATQLMVFVNENGRMVSIGAIDANANQQEFIQRFFLNMPREGEGPKSFMFRPLDANGDEMGIQSQPIIISDTHVDLIRLRATRRAGTSVEGDTSPVSMALGMAGLDPNVLRLIETVVKHSQDNAAKEREHARTQAQQLGDERMAVATNATVALQNSHERTMELEAKRQADLAAQMKQHQDVAMQQQQQLFQAHFAMAEAQRAAAEAKAEREMREMELRIRREREEMELRRTRDREEFEQKMKMLQFEADRRANDEALKREALERLEDQRRREEREERDRRDKAEREERERRDRRDREDREAADKARQREHEMAMAAMKLRAEADAAHAERMASIEREKMGLMLAQAEKQESGGLEALLNKGKNLLETFGMDPKEVLSSLVGGGKDEGTSAETAAVWANLASTVVSTVGRAVQTKFIADAQKSRGAEPSTALARRAAVIEEETEDEEDLEDEEETEEEDESGGDVSTPAPRAAAPVAPTGAAPVGQAVNLNPAPIAVAPPVMSVQRLARKALQGLVKRCNDLPEDQWRDVILTTVIGEPAIGPYLNWMGIRGGLLEAGATADQTARVIQQIRETNLLPANFNYGD